MKTTYEVKYNGESAWGYKLINTVNKMWYYGIGQGDIEKYDTGSYNPKLMNAFSKGQIEREIVRVDNSYRSMQIWERELLSELDAENDDTSYNDNNGFSKIKRLPRVDMCKDIADEIRKYKSYCGYEITDIDLSTEKEFKGKIGILKPTSFLRDWGSLQPRHNLYVAEHLKNLEEKIDQYKGNLEAIEQETGQTLFGVVLQNRKQKNKPKADLKIDGNHTFESTVRSRYGFTLKVLYIPESIHNDWTEDEIRLIAEYLNPIDEMTTLQTAEEDAIKTAVELSIKYDKDSSVVNDYLNKHKFTSKAKDRIKKNVTTQLNKMDKEAARPKNFIDHTLPEYREIMKDKVNDYEIESGTYSTYWSSSKASIGDYASKMLKKIYQGKENLKKIKLLIHHPSVEAQETFEKDYEVDFENWQRIFKHEKVELTWEEMPMTKEERA